VISGAHRTLEGTQICATVLVACVPDDLIVYYYPQEMADFWHSARNRSRSADLRDPQLFWTGGVLQCERKKNDRSEKR
jgi:hypothetical protein